MNKIMQVHIIKFLTHLIVVIGLLITITGCGGGGGEEARTPSRGAVESTIVPDSVPVEVEIGTSVVISSVIDGDITWTFSSSVESGKFANGDTWVVGPVTITSITPDFDGDNNGFEVNPIKTSQQGFDNRIGDYRTSLIPALPYIAQPGDSIIKVASVDKADTNCRPCINSASVLTVLTEAPLNNGATIFRPPYFGTNKPLYSTDDLNYSLLPNYAPTSKAKTFDTVANQYRSVQLDHKVGWTGRALHPLKSMPDYGSAIARRNSGAAVTLMTEGTEQDKKQAVINYVNYGIDIYHMAMNGVTWPAAGGHGEGRKVPVIMAAVLLENDVMKSDLTNIGSNTFGETSGVFFSAAADSGNGKVLFGQEARSELEYWKAVVFQTGSRTIIDPYSQIDGGPVAGGFYQICCLSIVWDNIVTALELMPSLKPIFNFPNLKKYTDRWMATGFHTQSDTCAPGTGQANFDADYGVVFGPDGSGGCIQDLDASDGIGRFPQLHSTNAGAGSYGSAFVTEMKATYLP